jgi:hypothetical protein
MIGTDAGRGGTYQDSVGRVSILLAAGQSVQCASCITEGHLGEHSEATKIPAVDDDLLTTERVKAV